MNTHYNEYCNILVTLSLWILEVLGCNCRYSTKCLIYHFLRHDNCHGMSWQMHKLPCSGKDKRKTLYLDIGHSCFLPCLLFIIYEYNPVPGCYIPAVDRALLNTNNVRISVYYCIYVYIHTHFMLQYLLN